MTRFIAAIVVVIAGLFAGKTVINLVSFNITLPSWPSSSSIPSTSHIPAEVPNQNRPSAESKLVNYSPGMQLFGGDGRPVAWYYKDRSGAIELYDAPGYHLRTGEKLLPITREIATELQRIARNCITYRNEDGRGKFLGYTLDCAKATQ